ncbi:MAG TPA: GGDEF domain-containing protein [Beijerinckiaceae bacterium]|nr:GGDEF domain-containing protein [Beijerinckiaceae bacterium]
MKPAFLPFQTEVRAEIGALRSEVERLASELEQVREHAATLEALALEDSLTGLLNRRGFVRDLGRAIAYLARYGTPAALMLADLDRFKPINDTYGHEVGDRALQHFAGVLKANLRASDTIGRLGGDEFAFVVWQVDAAKARHKAAALAGILGATPLKTAGVVLNLATSIGVTALEPQDTPDGALARADKAMYAEKARRKAGRT